MIEFTVWGEPQGKERPRMTRTGHTYTPQKTRTYEAEVVSSFLRDCPDFIPWEKGVPLRVRIKAVYAIPQSVSKAERTRMLTGQKRPTRRPDLDNLEKCLMDAGNSVIWHDDAQIVDLKCTKEYGEEPRVEVTVKEIAY